MEEIKQEIRNKDFWTNVRDLVQINLMQQKNITIGMCLALLVYLVFLNICTAGAFYSSNTLEYYYIVNGFSGIIWIGIYCVLLQEYQLFTSETVSMYPGNAMTRFLGRVIADHIRILIFILCVGIAYFVQYGVFWVLLHGKAGVDVRVFFDLRYLGVGLLRLCVTSMALYGAFALFFAVDAKWGHKCSIVLLIGIPIIMGATWKSVGVWVTLQEWIQKWITTNTNLPSYLGMIALIWLVCVMVSGILAWRIRYWRMSRIAEFIIIPIGIVLASMFIVLRVETIGSEDIADSGEEIIESGNDAQEEEENLCISTMVDLPEGYEAELEEDMVELVAEENGKRYGSLLSYINGSANLGFTVAGVSEAEYLKIPEDVDLSDIQDNHAMVIFQIPNVQLVGKEIFRDLAEEVQGKIKQVENGKKLKLEYHGKLRSTICMDFFPSADRFLYHDSRNRSMEEYYRNSPYVQVIVLMSDDRCGVDG